MILENHFCTALKEDATEGVPSAGCAVGLDEVAADLHDDLPAIYVSREVFWIKYTKVGEGIFCLCSRQAAARWHCTRALLA